MTPFLAASALIFLPWVIGELRARSLSLESGPLVAVVGTAVQPAFRQRADKGTAEAVSQVLEATQALKGADVDLVVLPEGSVPVPLEEGRGRQALGTLRGLAEALEAPVLFGALGRVGPGPHASERTNSAFLLRPGAPEMARYDKRWLVPAMEAGAYRAGAGAQLFSVGPWRMGPLVCYESLYSRAVSEAKREGAQLLVNITSDIWFGRGGGLLGLAFLAQHPAHLVLRVVESRLPAVRAANGGFSTVLGPSGRSVEGILGPEGGLLVAQVPLWSGTTLFSRTGDWVGPASLLVCVLLMALAGSGPRSTTG